MLGPILIWIKSSVKAEIIFIFPPSFFFFFLSVLKYRLYYYSGIGSEDNNHHCKGNLLHTVPKEGGLAHAVPHGDKWGSTRVSQEDRGEARLRACTVASKGRNRTGKVSKFRIH